MSQRLTGLIAATHTPFTSVGALHLAAIEGQCHFLLRAGVQAVFIAGTTGESSSLTLEERLQLTERWLAVARGTPMQVVVHVGSNCLLDACTLAAQAGRLGARAISALAPSYFKPRDVPALVACAAQVASAAPETAFYFYDIPAFTGVHLSMPAFLEQAARQIPNLAGLKFTNADLVSFQHCLRASDRANDILYGFEELVWPAWSLGGRGFIGTSFTFTAPIFQRLLLAAEAGNQKAAAEEQYRVVQTIQLLAGYGYLGAAKALLGLLGVELGPVRLPNTNVGKSERERLRGELEKLGFFDWIEPA